MKTTLNIDDQMMKRLREESGRRRVRMFALVEAGLRRLFDESAKISKRKPGLLDLPSWPGGPARVDISNREALYKKMEDA